jgi:hypothetical protein
VTSEYEYHTHVNMSYVPPHLRNKKDTPVETKPVLHEDNFPALGGGGTAPRENSSLQKGSFADQALRWKEQRERDEYEQRVKKEIEALRAEKKKQEMFEEQLMRQSLPSFRPREVHTYTRPVVRDSWSAPADDWEVAGEKKKQKHLGYLQRKESERIAKLNTEEHSEESGGSQNNDEDIAWNAEDAY